MSGLTSRTWIVVATLGAATLAVSALWAMSVKRPSTALAAPVDAKADEADKAQVAAFCGACHAVPPPDSFPREAWDDEVAQGYRFSKAAGSSLAAPPEGAVRRYYEHRAPDVLPIVVEADAPGPSPFRFERKGFQGPGAPTEPAVANVRFVRLVDGGPLELLACDMRQGLVLRLRPGEPSPRLEVIADQLHSPAHLEVADLDGDGRRDVLVADLGSFLPSDEKQGSVDWLRARPDGGFDPMPLAWGLGRVADVQAADFDLDGDLDLIVAVFGMHAAGEILLLENRTKDYAQPAFTTTRLDPRHGAIHVPVADLNGDGKPDFVALIGQEHETIVAFLNRGGGRFDREVIHNGPHPAYGSSGIQLVDLDGDGDLDVLYTNGDVMDTRAILRPEHGIQWLENVGGFPYRAHRLAALYGASRAEAVDLDGDGDLDIVATSFLPGPPFRLDRKARNLASVLALEQVEPGRFARHTLEATANDHATCAVGDFDGDGRVDLAVGNFTSMDRNVSNAEAAGLDWVTLWKNVGDGAARSAGHPPGATSSSSDPAPGRGRDAGVGSGSER